MIIPIGTGQLENITWCDALKMSAAAALGLLLAFGVVALIAWIIERKQK